MIRCSRRRSSRFTILTFLGSWTAGPSVTIGWIVTLTLTFLGALFVIITLLIGVALPT
jgi:hypothetical protein